MNVMKADCKPAWIPSQVFFPDISPAILSLPQDEGVRKRANVFNEKMNSQRSQLYGYFTNTHRNYKIFL